MTTTLYGHDGETYEVVGVIAVRQDYVRGFARFTVPYLGEYCLPVSSNEDVLSRFPEGRVMLAEAGRVAELEAIDSDMLANAY